MDQLQEITQYYALLICDRTKLAQYRSIHSEYVLCPGVVARVVV